MIRNRRPDWRRIKSKTSYTFDEAARALGVHRNTLRHWVRDHGLPAIMETRPFLILGADLVTFLRQRRKSRKRKCGIGELYCLKCRAPRKPVPDLIEFRQMSQARAAIVGICLVCETLMHRFISSRRAASVAAEFNVQIAIRDGSLTDCAHPALNCHSKPAIPA